MTCFPKIATLENPKANISVSRSVLFSWYWLLLTQRLLCVEFSQDPLDCVYIILLSELSSENEHLGTHQLAPRPPPPPGHQLTDGQHTTNCLKKHSQSRGPVDSEREIRVYC